jgi:hypothetical protein
MLICLNQANRMKEANIVRQASRVLGERLPAGWKQRIMPAKGRPPSGAALEITGPDGAKTRLAIEAKTSLFPRDVDALRSRIEDRAGATNLIVARFLKSSTRRRLRENNLNYLDLTGNLRLVTTRPGLYVETSGADADPEPPAEPNRSLRGPKAGRVVRALCDFPLPLAISDLAANAGVDVSYASRLVEWLAREALLTRAPRGSVLQVDRPQLIRRWSEDYGVFKSNDVLSFLDPRGLDHLVRSLNQIRFRYAVTGSLAANRIAPIAPARLAIIYVDDPDAAAAALKLRPTKAGANVMLLTPFDSVVFERTRRDKQFVHVAPSQAAVDLLTGPGRAPAEADAILERLALPPP